MVRSARPGSERAGGPWLLAATDDPLDAERPDHIAQPARLIDHLGLADLQRRGRLPPQ